MSQVVLFQKINKRPLLPLLQTLCIVVNDGEGRQSYAVSISNKQTIFKGACIFFSNTIFLVRTNFARTLSLYKKECIRSNLKILLDFWFSIIEEVKV